jgi:hypothetical protein
MIGDRGIKVRWGNCTVKRGGRKKQRRGGWYSFLRDESRNECSPRQERGQGNQKWRTSPPVVPPFCNQKWGDEIQGWGIVSEEQKRNNYGPVTGREEL